MKTRRKFSPEFKTKVVLQLLSGEKSNAELCREHRITAQMLGNWKGHFLSHASSVFESGNGDSAESECRVMGENALNGIGWMCASG